MWGQPGRGRKVAWWIWILLGIALLTFEVAVSGALFALFFGLGALLVAPLAAVGLPAVTQWLVFPALSVAGLLTMRGPLVRRVSRRPWHEQELVGERGHVLDDLRPGDEGRVELRGTTWMARVSGAQPLIRGQRCVVERVDGLMLWVRGE